MCRPYILARKSGLIHSLPRSEACGKSPGRKSRRSQVGLTHLYNVMDDGGYRDLAACHLRLDRAVTACYGWPRMVAQDRGELVARLARLNAEIVASRPYSPFPRRAESESATYVEQTFYDL